MAKGGDDIEKKASPRSRTTAAKESDATKRSGTANGAKAPPKPRPRGKAPATNGDSFPIVGIGMSAGGLEIATTFLKAMPVDSGMGFVIVQHLDPTRESLLAELLQRTTKMPVVQITEGMRVEPNRVHIIIPDKTLLIADGVLRLVPPQEKRGLRHPIDKFFSALAQDQKTKAIAIILSGAGSNGSAGLMDIKQCGGMCMAQDPKTAKFDSMPRHAIASGMIDFVLAPEDMPEALLRYTRHSYVEDVPSELDENGESKGAVAEIADVLALLLTKGGHDFRQYKHNTLSRRIHRRMGLAYTEKLDAYMALLEDNPDEVMALGKDLLINVTAFFRDAEAWDALDRDVITPLVEQAERGQTIRAWVPACSTGEEAYTIAMLLAERGEAADKDLGIKIFATDAADHHLGAARRATFPGSMVESLSPERIARFFDKIDDSYYRIKSKIRETVLFAPQNLLQDPPYSRMDLVSCRNLLIYLEPEAQDKVLSLAHFALRQNGYLFLGNAESVGRRGHLYETVSKRWRIYRRLGPARSAAIDFTNWPKRGEPVERPSSTPQLSEIALKTLADRFAPASVLIDRNYRVLHFHGRTEDFLVQPAGAPTMDLLALVRDGLALTVRSAVQKAIAESASVTLRATVKSGSRNDVVLVTVNLVGGADTSAGMSLVSFAKDVIAPAGTKRRAAVTHVEAPGLRDLEEELRTARDEMRGTIEQFETTNEELTAANEEITSVNEELQSTNEELEATKEEQQSLNEELTTINAQLDRKIIELDEASDDLRNLLMGNEVATLFIDSKMRIKWFTPAIRTLFDLIDQDVGRPLANFSQKFPDVGLVDKARESIERLTTFQEEVRADDRRCYQLRVQPYRTRDNQIAGAVATFVDIHELKATQSEIEGARDYAEAIVETVRDPLLVLGGDLRVISANAAFYRLFEAEPRDTVGRLVYELGSSQWDLPKLRLLLEEMLPEQGQINEFDVEIPIAQRGLRCLSLNARRIEGEDDRPELILIALEDITDRLEASRHRELMVGELSHRVKNMLAVVQSIAFQTARNSPSLDAFNEAFQGRLQALAGANDSIIRGDWKGVCLFEIVKQAMDPFAANDQVTIDGGPIIDLRPQASLALAMILHELATNAVKYGSLSVPKGCVKIDWRIETSKSGDSIVLEWVESGGPAVESPARTGQGTRFIEGSIAHELKGKASVSFDSTGLCAVLTFPLAAAILADTNLVSENTNA